jgi:hypothetical protein
MEARAGSVSVKDRRAQLLVTAPARHGSNPSRHSRPTSQDPPSTSTILRTAAHGLTLGAIYAVHINSGRALNATVSPLYEAATPAKLKPTRNLSTQEPSRNLYGIFHQYYIFYNNLHQTSDV